MASRDRDKPSAELLRRSLAQQTGAAGECPGPEILVAYFEHSLDGAEIARYEQHLSECGRCREQLAALVRADEPATAAEKTGERASGWSRLWDWRLLVPSFAVLLIAAGIWYVERPGHLAGRTPAQEPLVAMSQQTQNPIAAAPQESAPETNEFSRLAPPTPAPAAPAAAKPAETTSMLAEKKEAAANQADESRATAQINSPTKTASVPEPAAPFVAGNAVPMSSASQSVEVTAAPPLPEAPAARIQSARQMKTDSGQANGTTAGTGGTISGAFMAGAGIARSKQTTAPGVAGQAAAQGHAVTLEATDDISPQKVIHTPNPKILWRIAGAGFVERSTDGGEIWQGQLPNPDAHFIAGAAPTSQICWLVGHDGIILLTTDATTWKAIPPPASADFVDVTAKDGSSATVTAADGRKFTTADGGKHWNPAP